jgi:hypothetical protein
MNCPKCSAGLVGFNDGTVKCTSCSYIGRLKTPDRWKEDLRAYLDTQGDEMVFDTSHIKTIVGYTLLGAGAQPPEEKVLDQFLLEYQAGRLGKVEVDSFDNGIHSYYTGQVKEGTKLRHGLGRQGQSDGLFYEGYFKDDDYNGYGYGEGPTGSAMIKCGWWENGKLVREMNPQHVAIKKARKAVKEIRDEYAKKRKEDRSEEDIAEEEFLYDADPNCKHVIVSGDNYSGIKCSKCRGWFCY